MGQNISKLESSAACTGIQYSVQRVHCTGIGRKNEPAHNICNSLTSSLGQPRSSFHCIPKLLTIINSFGS